ncbi:MAG: diaminopimelate decarboxylase [Bacteroidota bacterium]|nr:diaminopimelate decarboxylase [Bacteroidota bacterium]
MYWIYSKYTKENNFYGKSTPIELIKKYGSPLYVYNEKILRNRCKEMKNLVSYPHFIVNYSAKANSNLKFLKIIKNEGLHVDAMSPGEIFIELKAGFTPKMIFYISNNVSADEMKFAIDAGVNISIDSISQLELYGKINSGGKVALRFNPGIGAGHNAKVVTGGKKTKFGIDTAFIPKVKSLLNQYNLKLIGINQHIGSLFMDSTPYIESVKNILSVAEQFEDLEFIDFGGGFGIPYYKQDYEVRLNIKALGEELNEIMHSWANNYGKWVTFKVEPGRYISAECGVLLGTVNAIKTNSKTRYVGTDIGFNVIERPVLYESHHDIEIYRESEKASDKIEEVNLVGNICESGDIIAKGRFLPEIFEDDIIGILDAGAYGHVMSSNYNSRLRPAEVFIDMDGNDILTRRRDTLDDLLKVYKIN